MPLSYRLETAFAFRLVEFDSWPGADVRVVVDGKRAAEMPYPRPEHPFGEVEFWVDDHNLIAIAYLLEKEPDVIAKEIEFDVFKDGRSLSGGPDLETARQTWSKPRPAYPAPFRVVDVTLQITPAAAGPGLGLALARSAETLGFWAVLQLGVVMFGALGIAVAATRRVWRKIRADEKRSVAGRVALGVGVMVATYAGAFVAAIALAIVLRGPI